MEALDDLNECQKILALVLDVQVFYEHWLKKTDEILNNNNLSDAQVRSNLKKLSIDIDDCLGKHAVKLKVVCGGEMNHEQSRRH